MAGLMLLLWRLCDMENLGVSYLSPLITTIVDTTTLLVYFNIAKALLKL